MAARPDLLTWTGDEVGFRARQPFHELRSSVLAACASELDLGTQDPRRAHVHMTESDRTRLAQGFDYSVPCIALGRSLQRRPDEVAAQLAGSLGREPTSALISGAACDGPYLNLSIDRRSFAAGVLESAESGDLAECRHDEVSALRYCLVPGDDSAPGELLEMLTGMAANCSGAPVDPLGHDPDDAHDLVDDLVARGLAERDPSGLTASVFMGQPGERFLLVDLSGEPTVPASMAARLARSAGRPVLLTVGAGNLELVHRVEAVGGAAGSTDVELRVIEVRRRWLRLLAEVRRGFADPDDTPEVSPPPERPASDTDRLFDNDEVFAVFRSLCRISEVNHRVLESTEAEHMLRFGEELRRRVHLAGSSGPEGARLAREAVRYAFSGLLRGGTARG